MPTHKPKRPAASRTTLLQAHPWHGIPARREDGLLNAFIEVVPTDTLKYEIDKASGHLRLDRPQRFSSVCPTPYGFIPQTYCGEKSAAHSAKSSGLSILKGDGDPLDICVLAERTIAHGNLLLTARPIGGLRMIDGMEADDKIIAILESDAAYGALRDLSDCPVGLIERLQHYFLSYKQRPDEPERNVRIDEVYGAEEAARVIDLSIADYEETFGPSADALRRLLGG